MAPLEHLEPARPMSAPPSPNQLRQRTWAALAQETFDLLVIGGGVIGCGVARDAALRGLKVALVEKDDFAAGTSSKSSKLIHGGLRYLQQAELKLVFEGTNERALLMRQASHLVRPLKFLFPSYRDRGPWLLTLDCGLWLYDALCGFRAFKIHRTYRAPKIQQLEPLLRRQSLVGGVVYYDCITDDARITLENAISAVAAGAHLLNHARATALLHGEDGRVCGATLVDAEPGGPTRAPVDVRAKVVVNASGPWTDEVRALQGEKPIVKATKGVHLVIDATRLQLEHAVVMLAPRDQRVMFAIPWGSRTVLGTTDTFFDGSPDEVHTTRADAEYVLEAARHYFPSAELTLADVLSTWAGLRPLIAPEAQVSNASAISREHHLNDEPGFITIAGGKLTTFRRIAVEVVDHVARQLSHTASSVTAKRPLPGADGLDAPGKIVALTAQLTAVGLPPPVCAHLIAQYGVRSSAIAERIAAQPALAEQLDPELPYLLAEIDEAVEVELARTLCDLLSRRIPLLLKARDLGAGSMDRAARQMAAKLEWSTARIDAEKIAYAKVVADALRFRDEPAAVRPSPDAPSSR